MKFGPLHPLYDVLVRSGLDLGYTEVHLLNEGRHAELAERLKAAAQKARYVHGFLHGSLSIMLFYRLGAALSAGGTEDIVWSCIMALVLAFSIPGSRKQFRATAKAISSLEQAADSAASGGAASRHAPARPTG